VTSSWFFLSTLS